MKTILLVDGNNIAYRSFFAIPFLTTSNQVPTNAVYGFVSMLLHVRKIFKPDYMAICFDSKEKTFKAQDYVDYKAQRKPMPDSLIQQMKMIKEDVLQPLGVVYYEKPGFEADDLIATLTKKCKEESIYVSILSGDRDMIQLVEDGSVEVMSPVSGFSQTKVFHEEEVKKDYGIKPQQMLDYKSLVGDPSDNIQGALGIGPKTAQKLLEKYGTIDTILADSSKETDKIRTQSNVVKENQRLIRLLDDVPVKIDTQQLIIPSFSHEVLMQIIRKFEFKSLIKRVQDFPKTLDKENLLIPSNTHNNKEDLLSKSLVTISLTPSGELFVFDGQNRYSFQLNQTALFSSQTDHEFIETLLQAKAVKKVIFDGKKLLHFLGPSIDFHWQNIIDMQLYWFLWKPNAKSYSEKDFLEENTDGNQSFDQLLFELYPPFAEEIKNKNLLSIYETIELPLMEVLYKMEAVGIKIAKPILLTLQAQIQEKILSLQKLIYTEAGTEFNILSPKQLGFILFDKLCLPTRKKTKTGFSTDSEVLDELTPMHPIVPLVILFKELSKIQNTYVNSFLLLADQDSLLHTTYLQAGPATGRISSINPNMQNLPMDEEWGRKLRKIFIPRTPDSSFISADYSQIDLRVMAHFSEDPKLLSAFHSEQDIHSQTAKLLFRLPPSKEPEDWMRKVAKTVNFGILYGMSSHGLASSLKISEGEARNFITTYFTTFSRVKEWIESTIESAKKSGYVETLCHRIRQIPELGSTNHTIQALGERLAVNTIIQGTSADIIKTAMIHLDKSLGNFQAKLLLQIHDELVLECLDKDIEPLMVLLKKEMENAVQLKIPLLVHLSFGKNLADLK